MFTNTLKQWLSEVQINMPYDTEAVKARLYMRVKYLYEKLGGMYSQVGLDG